MIHEPMDIFMESHVLDFEGFQEYTTKPFPLYIEEKHCVEICHSVPTKDKEKIFPMFLVYDDYDSDPWESHEEEEGESSVQFISYPEPANEQPSSGISQPALSVPSLILAREIQPCVRSCKTDHVFCHQPIGFCHYLYEPVREYMELHSLHVLEPLNFILTSALGGELKRVIILLSQ
jgi:hypothetical protein